MKRSSFRVGAALAACTVLASTGVLVSAPAMAVNGNIAYGLQYGNVDRASFSEHENAIGYRINSYGSSPCSSTYADMDLGVAGVRPDWNDAVSWVSDWNQCDTVLYRHANFVERMNGGYENFGGGRNLTWTGMNDQMTSYALS